MQKKFDLNNYTGADLNAFVESAARNAAWKETQNEKITINDFHEAFKQCKPSLKEDDLIYYENIYKKFNWI